MDAFPLRHPRSLILLEGKRAMVVKVKSQTLIGSAAASSRRSARWNEKMDERSAGRDRETGANLDPQSDARGYPSWPGASMLHTRGLIH
jgi:hypothetical protein